MCKLPVKPCSALYQSDSLFRHLKFTISREIKSKNGSLEFKRNITFLVTPSAFVIFACIVLYHLFVMLKVSNPVDGYKKISALRHRFSVSYSFNAANWDIDIVSHRSNFYCNLYRNKNNCETKLHVETLPRVAHSSFKARTNEMKVDKTQRWELDDSQLSSTLNSYCA